jgi:hypothetical protein
MADVDGIIDQILAGQFAAAIAASAAIPFDQVREQVLLRAFDEHHLALYGFYVALLQEQPTAAHQHAAAELLGMGLNVYPGAYQTAAYHARQAAATAPDEVAYKEFLLFLHQVPDEVVGREESLRIAGEILALDPDNEAARQVLAQPRE